MFGAGLSYARINHSLFMYRSLAKGAGCFEFSWNSMWSPQNSTSVVARCQFRARDGENGKDDRSCTAARIIPLNADP